MIPIVSSGELLHDLITPTGVIIFKTSRINKIKIGQLLNIKQ